jgi:hypothetical protein
MQGHDRLQSLGQRACEKGLPKIRPTHVSLSLPRFGDFATSPAAPVLAHTPPHHGCWHACLCDHLAVDRARRPRSWRLALVSISPWPTTRDVLQGALGLPDGGLVRSTRPCRRHGVSGRAGEGERGGAGKILYGGQKFCSALNLQEASIVANLPLSRVNMSHPKPNKGLCVLSQGLRGGCCCNPRRLSHHFLAGASGAGGTTHVFRLCVGKWRH